MIVVQITQIFFVFFRDFCVFRGLFSPRNG
jgi:hypothetical protein